MAANPARQNLSNSSGIAARVADDFLQNRVRPGDRLDGRELNETFGNSRTPARSASQRLSTSGLAVARGRQGLQVAQFSVADRLNGLRLRPSWRQ